MAPPPDRESPLDAGAGSLVNRVLLSGASFLEQCRNAIRPNGVSRPRSVGAKAEVAPSTAEPKATEWWDRRGPFLSKSRGHRSVAAARCDGKEVQSDQNGCEPPTPSDRIWRGRVNIMRALRAAIADRLRMSGYNFSRIVTRTVVASYLPLCSGRVGSPAPFFAAPNLLALRLSALGSGLIGLCARSPAARNRHRAPKRSGAEGVQQERHCRRASQRRRARRRRLPARVVFCVQPWCGESSSCRPLPKYLKPGLESHLAPYMHRAPLATVGVIGEENVWECVEARIVEDGPIGGLSLTSPLDS
jgi:hypothetical protein